MIAISWQHRLHTHRWILAFLSVSIFILPSLVWGEPSADREPSEPMLFDSLEETGYADDTGFVYAGAVISSIVVRGNVRVEDNAIKDVMATEVGRVPDRGVIADDIRSIHELGYFSEVEIRSRPDRTSLEGGIQLVVVVEEKPAISNISFEGFEGVSKDDVKEKLQMKKYTIVNETLIASDLEVIERMHRDKGYFLARASYEIRDNSSYDPSLQKPSASEVELIYRVEPGEKLYLGRVNIVGNNTFSDRFLQSFMQSQPFSHMKSLFGALIYREMMVQRDEELLAYLYRDRGFAQVKVSETIAVLSSDQKYMDLTFQLEEGPRFHMRNISFSGDLLFDNKYLSDLVTIRSDEYFRISLIKESLDNLVDEYGDLGYAFVDVNPEMDFDEENNKADLNFAITKGEKAYFGKFSITGNTKTRDNIVRRQLTIADGDLFSRTGLRESRQQIESLGFFESVKFVRKIDEDDPSILHYTIRVKEKSTGQIQGSLGYTPAGYTNANWFAQGQFEEKNLLGKAYGLDVSATYSNEDNYGAKVFFSNPRILDSRWFFGVNAGYQMQNVVSLGFGLKEQNIYSSMYTGREIIESIRGSVGLELARTKQTTPLYLSKKLRISGDTVGVRFVLSRRVLNNYIDPTSGTHLELTQRFVGEALGGDYSYQESEFKAIYYHPFQITENFDTHIKLNLRLAKLSAFGASSPPLFRRYRLGGAYNLRGFAPNSISPRFVLWRTPFDYDQESYYPKGGDRKLVFQTEYYLPLIQQAKMKALLFFDTGRVFDNNESWTFANLYSNVGFGVRWVTPMGPLRFEWAFPFEENGRLGPYRLVFNLGY